MFHEDPAWWAWIIKYFIGIWTYGQGWYAPLYYGALTAIAYSLRNRLGWQGQKPLLYFVIGVSLTHGAVSALILLVILLAAAVFGRETGAWIPVLFPIALNIFGLRQLLRSLAATVNNRIDLAKPLLIRGGVSVALIFALVLFLGNQIVNAH